MIFPNQVLEVAVFNDEVGLTPAGHPMAYLDIDDTGLVEACYGPETGIE